jgi:hypothetical protein
MAPAVGRISPTIWRNSVDLPAPLGPRMPTTWPPASRKLIPSLARTRPPKTLVSPLTRRWSGLSWGSVTRRW